MDYQPIPVTSTHNNNRSHQTNSNNQDTLSNFLELDEAAQQAALKKLRSLYPEAGACYKEESDTDTASEGEETHEGDIYPMQPCSIVANMKTRNVTLLSLLQIF